jgi:hypothetical protein
MKKLAYFVALFIGLNATPVVRKPEDDDNQMIVQKDKQHGYTNPYTSVVQSNTNNFLIYFYAITFDGLLHKISWDRIYSLFINTKPENQIIKSDLKKKAESKTNWIVYQFKRIGDSESIDFLTLEE